VRRSALLWLALFAVYAATLGLHASGDAPLAPGEARVLLGAESIVSDGDVDLRDEYRSRAYDGWVQTGRLEPVAGLTEGRLHEPPGVGTALVLAGPYAIAGGSGRSCSSRRCSRWGSSRPPRSGVGSCPTRGRRAPR
jgi:hypothetical protein